MSEERRMYRGCFFCKGGREADVVQQFQTLFPGGRAVAPTRSRYRRGRDTATEERVLLLPGYVFFELEAGSAEGQAPGLFGDDKPDDSLQAALTLFSRRDSVLRLLRYSDGRWQLHDHDDRFAKMLFETGGNIGISQACFDVGRRIRILSGFLKDHEGSITRVNRKNRTVEVRVDLQGKRVSMKLGYELVTGTDPMAAEAGDQTE